MRPVEPFANVDEEASSTLVQRLHGHWTAADQAALEQRLATDPAYAHAYRLAGESVDVLRSHAEMPEMMQFRERALAHARRSSVNRWSGANTYKINRWALPIAICAAAVAITLAVNWQQSPWGDTPNRYHTGTGEQRIVELEDHSRIALDAQTRLAIHYTGESRTIELSEGQAQFSVAKDPARPFRVRAGDRTIVALGTVFTVEIAGRKVNVAMMEGRVAVIARSSAHPADAAIELSAGEALSVEEGGHSTVIPKADIEAATAWRNGKVVFRTERLGDAVRRMNRYTRVQLEVTDPALADEKISGVFDAGDTQGFIAGLHLALPVEASEAGKDIVRLTSRR